MQPRLLREVDREARQSAGTPIVYAFIGASILSPFLALIAPQELLWMLLFISSAGGWVIAASFLWYRYLLNAAAEAPIRELREQLSADIEDDIVGGLADAARYHRAAFSIRLGKRYGRELESTLQRLIALTQKELGAEAVELSLFDELSGLWSKSFLAGCPQSAELQMMLAAKPESEAGDVIDMERDIMILTEPIRFASMTFGMLRVEFPPGVRPTESDRTALRLLGAQGAVILIDSRFTEEIIRMRRVSDESVQAKTGFLANLSHEIRGPLGIIINGVELGLEGLCGEISDQMKETLRMIKDSGDHLLDLVNDVLDYAKVEAGKVTPKPAPIQLEALLSDLANVVRTQALAKEHKLVVEPVDPEIFALCDKRHVRQILINLLTNAVKYTPEGGSITIKAERHVGDRVKISVSDTGIGIPADQRDKVFGAFERVEHKYATAQVGTGLGMPLTLKLAEANGGTVDFESHEGKGSTFWVILPAAPAAEEGAEEAAAAAKPIHIGRGERILLVDPDLGARQMVETYLQHQGFSVLRAGNGKDILRVLRDQPVDICIVENDLPDLSGEEVISVIRAHPRATTVPLILLSARAFVFDIERFLKLGVDRCLSKPVDLGELASTARRLLDETTTEDAR